MLRSVWVLKASRKDQIDEAGSATQVMIAIAEAVATAREEKNNEDIHDARVSLGFHIITYVMELNAMGCNAHGSRKKREFFFNGIRFQARR